MERQDGDWLDGQLAATSYLPDEGFTRIVVQKLPKAPARPISIRTKIMLLAGLVACCLIGLLVPASLEAFRQFAANPAVTSVLSKAAPLLHQPIMVYAEVSAVVALLIAVVPLARRWA